jgi:hypothetical protein
MIMKNLDTLKVAGFDAHKLITQMHNSSNALTALAGNFTSTTDPKIVDQQVLPHLKEIKAITDSIKELVSASNSPNKANIQALTNKLINSTKTIEEAMNKYSKATELNQTDIDNTVTVNAKASNATTLSLIDTQKSLGSIKVIASDLEPEIKELDLLIKKTAVSIVNNSGKSLTDVYKIQRTLASTKNLINKLVARDSPACRDSIELLTENAKRIEEHLHAISLANIIPRNVDKVISDAQIINSRWSGINTSLWSTFDKDTLNFTNQTMTELIDIIKDIEENRMLLNENIVNGRALKRQQ